MTAEPVQQFTARRRERMAAGQVAVKTIKERQPSGWSIRLSHRDSSIETNDRRLRQVVQLRVVRGDVAQPVSAAVAAVAWLVAMSAWRRYRSATRSAC